MIDNVSIPEDFNLPARQTLEQKKKDDTLFDEALALIKEKNALLIAHYYTSETMQRLCEAAGGFIGDSLEMARMGRDSDKMKDRLKGLLEEISDMSRPIRRTAVKDVCDYCDFKTICGK